MKKIIAILILCSMLSSITGCSNSNQGFQKDTMLEDNEKTNVESEQGVEKEDDLDADKEVLAPKKTTVTEVVYQEVLPYLDNRIVVKQAGLYGIIDNLGNIVMPITQKCKIQPLPNETVALIDDDKYGVLSLNGDVLVPAIYDAIDIISEDLMLFQQLNGSSKNNSINANDEDYRDTITRFYSIKNRDYIDLEITDAIERVTVGQSIFTISCLTEGKHRLNIISFDGEVIGVTEIASHTHYRTRASGSGSGIESLVGTIYKTSNNNEYMVTQKHVIDIRGNIIVDLTDENSHFIFDESKDLCCSDEIIISEGGRGNYAHYVFNLISHKKEKIAVLDNNTKVSEEVMSNGFYEISTLPEGNSYTCYFGLMNDKYEIIVDPIYNSIEDCVNGYFPVMLNDCVGYVDDSGHLTVPPKVSISDLNSNGYFSYNFVVNDGSLIDPRTGELLPYQKAELLHDAHYEKGIFQAILTDEKNGDKYKSFVTWDGPIVDHKFPNQKITISQDGKVAVYNKGALYTIVEIQ